MDSSAFLANNTASIVSPNREIIVFQYNFLTALNVTHFDTLGINTQVQTHSEFIIPMGL